MSKRESKANQQPRKFVSWKAVAFTAILSAGAALFAERYLAPTLSPSAKNQIKTSRQCRPPLPNLFADNPIQADQPEIKTTLQRVDAFVRKSFGASQIDGLAVGIVTSKGAIYEIGMGPLKANETDPQKRGTIDRNSIFRLASGSKLFVALEALILREKGALQWFATFLKQFYRETLLTASAGMTPSTNSFLVSHTSTVDGQTLTLHQWHQLLNPKHQ
jgi:hypothetical protein